MLFGFGGSGGLDRDRDPDLESGRVEYLTHTHPLTHTHTLTLTLTHTLTLNPHPDLESGGVEYQARGHHRSFPDAVQRPSHTTEYPSTRGVERHVVGPGAACPTRFLGKDVLRGRGHAVVGIEPHGVESGRRGETLVGVIEATRGGFSHLGGGGRGGGCRRLG